MKNNKESFFEFSGGKIGITIFIVLLFYSIGKFCAFSILGDTSTCGELAIDILILPFTNVLFALLYLILFYILSSLIIYIWRKSNRR